MKTQRYEVTIDVTVHSRRELFDAAMKHALEHDGMTRMHALATLTTRTRAIDVGACLQMLLDPGLSPDGCDIEESYVQTR